MADILIWLVAVLGAAGGIIFGRFWGRMNDRRAGKKEAERDALEDTNIRAGRGRKAVRDGRNAGDHAERLRKNDGHW